MALSRTTEEASEQAPLLGNIPLHSSQVAVNCRLPKAIKTKQTVKSVAAFLCKRLQQHDVQKPAMEATDDAFH